MTPRRILMLVGGLAAFGAAYFAYAQLFGWLDGLPLLPARMLKKTDGDMAPPVRLTSPTMELIKLAFGDNSPETESAHYPTQLRFLQGESTMVLAAGSPPSNPNSNRITLAPFSMAVFGKPRPQHLMKPGESIEISTVHSDRAVLEFDRVIQSATEMNNAKLVRLELISDPEQAIPDAFQRVGKVHITNNQRFADPNRRMLMRTVGPVFYRDPKVPAGTPPLTGPDIWTDAFVEIVDRSNLPRRPDDLAAVAPAKAEDVRNPEAVAAILAGKRLPPPTVTAVGMRVYLEQKAEPGKPAPKREGASVGGVQRVEFLEKVVMNLWVDGGQGLVGSGGKPSAVADPPPGMIALGGGLIPGGQTARSLSRDLLQVETRGPFAYDAEKNLARFDVLPLADPNLPNDVQVTKVPPRAGTQTLFSQVLELEFNGSPTGTPPPGTEPAKPAEPSGSGSKFKRLHAWTYTPGRFVTIASDADQLQAYGQDLTHVSAVSQTKLTGSPLYAVQQRNVLTAGGAKQPAVLILDQPPAVAGQSRKMQATVLGPGRVELFDAATNASNVTASWLTSMVQSKEMLNDVELELYTLTDNAKFEDVKSDFWLKGKVLKLWLAPPAKEPGAPADTKPGANKPHRLQAIGDVTGHSADLDIEQSDHLNTLFRDVPPPAPVAGPVAPVSPAAPPPMPADPAPAPKEPAKPQPKQPDEKKSKPPLKLKARTIDTWVTRYPLPKVPAMPPVPNSPLVEAAASDKAANGMKYQMEKARCEGMVTVHQDPADPRKPRGTDIIGSRLIIDSTTDGSVLTVFGWDDRPGEVHNEGTSLIGPKVLIDQLHNLASVEGRGSLVMPTSSDLSGSALKQSEVVVVHFRDGMVFKGAQKVADFFGRVSATQGSSWVTCHTLQVNFDRPIYLSQANRPPASPNEEKPKIDVVYCYPAPADTADSPQEKEVWYNQLERDAASGRPIRQQKLKARELTLRAQTRDPSGGEPYKLLIAEGPGVLRIWQPGSKDDSGSGPKPDGPAAQQTEMKLTVVTFSGRMTGKDKGAVYKEATFLDSIQVIDVASESPDLQLERHKLPRLATLLTCADKLVVWSHSKPKEPAEQHMTAYGNAYLRNEEYDGWGETIENNGKVVIFDGMGLVPARIRGRFNGNDQSGRRIIYDRATNHYKVEGSVGGTINQGGTSSMPLTTPKK